MRMAACIFGAGMAMGLASPVAAASAAVAPQPGEDAAIVDVTKPRGETREIDFTTDEGTWMSVDIAPDGNWIVFDMLGHIYRIPAKGGEAVSLTQGSGIAVNHQPRISPDGSRIAFISDRGGQENLWIMNADGSDPRAVVLDDDARFAEPAWMPDGATIVVTKRAKTAAGFYRTNDSLWMFPAAGGAGRKLVEMAASGNTAQSRVGFWAGSNRAQWASPTPDGRFVYFHLSNFAGGNRRLARVAVASGEITMVTDDKAMHQQCCGYAALPSHLLDVAPRISPDGRFLAFARKLPEGSTSHRGQELNGRTTLWVRDLATGGDRMVMDPISNTLGELHPAWQTSVLPGYAWSKDGTSLLLSQGGKIRRLLLADGSVETIPFTARVQRTISQQARGALRIDSDAFTAKAIRWAAASPKDGTLVFEAVGKLWRQATPDAVPVALTPEMHDAFQLTPSWSADGKWIAFATSSDVDGGHLWKVSADGKRLMRLTRGKGRYLYPSWSEDGKTVLASRWPNELTYEPFSSMRWQIVRLSANGGEAVAETAADHPADISYGPGGSHWALRGDQLLYYPTLGAKPQTVAEVPGIERTDGQVAVSPDGKWAAYWYLHDIYLVEMPAATTGAPPKIDPLSGKRLSFKGGYYPRWTSNDTLLFTSAASWHSYRVTTGEMASSAITLKVSRGKARGSIAFTDAHILGVGGAADIARGTVVIRDDRIACVGDCVLTGIDKVISLGGKLVTPGFVDTHAHHLTDDGVDGMVPQHRASSAAYLAYGVTTTFDPSILVTGIHSFSVGEMTAAGRIVGASAYSTGSALTCGEWAGIVAIGSFAEAQNQVDRLVDLGAPSIKDYKQCTRLQRTWVAEAARRRGVSLTSEGSDYHYILGLIMTGQTGWEHALIVKPTYSDAARFFGQAGAHYSTQLAIAGDYPDATPLEFWLSQKNLWRDAKAMRWHSWQQMAPRRIFLKKPKSDYGFPMQSVTAADIRRAGGFATTGGHGEMKGLDTHFEMWSLAQSMTPHETLEAASYGGAHFLGMEQEIGSIGVGKIADLVIFEGDPLADIQQSTSIRYVMKSGRLYNADTLDEIWPATKPYGVRPWTNADIALTDDRPDNAWDPH